MKTRKSIVSITIVFVVLVLFLLPACGNNRDNSSRSDQPDGPPGPLQTAATYTVEPIVWGDVQLTSLASFSTTVYWSDDRAGIWKYDTQGGGDPVLLSQYIHDPTNAVVQGGFLYWVDSVYATGARLLYRSSLDGKETILLREGQNLQTTTGAILVDDAAVYWMNGADYYSPAQIEKVPLDGSAPQTLYTAPHDIYAVAMSGNYLYWLEGAASYNLYRIPKSGGTAEILSEGLAGIDCMAIDPSANIAVDGNYIYIAFYTKIIRVPVAGGTPEVLLQSNEICPNGTALYGPSFYWINGDSTGLPDYGGSRAILSLTTDTSGGFSVVSPNLGVARNIHATASGLYWDENQALKRRLWESNTDETLATGIYVASSYITDDAIYFAEHIEGWNYSRLGRLSLAAGTPETLLGGLNNSNQISLLPTSDYLYIGDGTSLKKVPTQGGTTETLYVNGAVWFSTPYQNDRLYENAGQIFVSSAGIYSIPVTGGSLTLLASDPGSAGIVSVQDGYVYYKHSSGLHRIPLGGGAPEVVYSVPVGSTMLDLDGTGTAYLKEWIWNDQYKLIKYDIAAGTSQLLYSGTICYLGKNDTALFINDCAGSVYRIPKVGGQADHILDIPYSLSVYPYWVNANAEDFYFGVYILNPGYISEIDLLRHLQ